MITQVYTLQTLYELSLIYSTLHMAFPRQPLLFTETVPHNSYETVEGNHM